jgi:GAF domain-containing protein
VEPKESCLADLLACVAAFGRSMQEAFDPRRFLAEFSACAQHLVPHDRVTITYLEDDGRTFTVFAEHRGIGPAVGAGRYTTDFNPAGRYAAEDWNFAHVFAGDVLVVDDAQRDPRFSGKPMERARAIATGVRGVLAVPIYAAGRVIGAFVVASFTPDVYRDEHVAACRQIADMIGLRTHANWRSRTLRFGSKSPCGRRASRDRG